MLLRWVDHKEEEHKVLDDYERNRTLIDLTRQPDEIKDAVDEAIINELLLSAVKHIEPRQINFQFMKFCGQHDLVKVAEQTDNIVTWMMKSYKGLIANLSEVEAWQTYKSLERKT